MSLEAFLSGIVAGYGIAIPVGPIAILILQLGLHRGFWIALSAGAGAASADLIYASVAALAGTFLSSILAPYAPALRVASALGLIAIGAWLLYVGRNRPDSDRIQFGTSGYLGSYGMVLGITLLNPVTVTYFTALILGMGAGSSQSSIDAILFISGAFLASLSWQSSLALVSGVAQKRLPRKARAATSLIGNFVIMALGIAILLGLRF